MEVIVRRAPKQSQTNQGRKRMGMRTASEAGRRRKVSGLDWIWFYLAELLDDTSLAAAGRSSGMEEADYLEQLCSQP